MIEWMIRQNSDSNREFDLSEKKSIKSIKMKNQKKFKVSGKALYNHFFSKIPVFLGYNDNIKFSI